MLCRSIVRCCLLCGCLALCVIALAANAPTSEPGTPTSVESARDGYARGHAGHYTAWVQYTLTSDRLHRRSAPRPSHFTADDRQPVEFRWHQADYAGGRWDIGHLCEAASATSERQVKDSFIITNTMPQDPALNRGQWARLEADVRGRAQPGDQVATGPAFIPRADGVLTIHTIGEHQLWVPTHCWKAALFERDGQREALAWLIPNRGVERFDDYRVSVDELEAAIGFDLFPGLDESLER